MQNNIETSLKKYSDYLESDVLESLVSFFNSSDEATTKAATLSVGNSFGASKDFQLLFSDNSEERDSVEAKLANSFHKNLHLLVEKTWVDQSHQLEKEQILAKLDTICSEFEGKKYSEAYTELQNILTKAVKLMFGEDTTSDDSFTEYALRIDPGFGTFWCFIQSLPQEAEWSADKIRSTLLLEMCFISNY